MKSVLRRAVVVVSGLLLGVLFSASAVYGAGRISGTVTDASTGEPLPGASVVIQGTSIGAATDLDGEYTIRGLAPGTYTVRASYVGYNPETQEVEVVDGETTPLDFELTWQAAETEEVVVTAQAEGQISAINQQLSSNTITNVVSGARIRELPDVNAAESIGRLPGVSIQRTGGEATKIAIRGLSPKYNTVTVNGVRLPATDPNNRSVDLSLISSNALDGIEVKKAVTPDMDADAFGGSVDLRLKSAPEDFSVDFTAQGGYNRLQDSYGNYKFAGSVSNRFFDDRLGVIANFNVDEYDRSADKLSADYLFTESAQTGEEIIRVSGIDLRDEQLTRSRAGGSVMLDYRIPAGQLTTNAFYQELDTEGLYRINNIGVGGDPRRYWRLEDRGGTTSILTGGVGIEQEFDLLRYDASLSYSSSRTENPEEYTWQFSQEGNVLREIVTEDTRPSDVPDITNVDTLSGLQEIFVWNTEREENVATAQLNLQLPFQFGTRINGYVKTGGKLRWLDRFNDEEQRGRSGLQYGSGAGNLNDPLECISEQLPEWSLDEIVGDIGVLPISMLQAPVEEADFLEGEFDLGHVSSIDVDSLRQLTRALQTCPDHHRNQAIGSRGSDYDGVERYQAGYVMAEFNIGNYITLLPGVRYERDYSEYEGQRFREIVTAWEAQEPAELDTLVNERDNSYWLPMVHLRVDPTDWLKIRLARTETLSRPDYIQYAPITRIDAFRSSVNAANGLLKPSRATNYDASVSVYQNHVGLFTVSAFHKKIDDLIISVNYTLQEGVPLLEGTNVPQGWYDGSPTLYTDINNPFEATYTGIEFDWQTNFWFLPSFLKGLVLNANYTYIQSETKYKGFFTAQGDSLIRVRPPVYNRVLEDTLREGRMPDQPSHIANVTVGYDFKGFSTRLSFLYQTDVSTYVDAINPLFDNFSGDYFRVDLSARQKIGEGLELFANLNNLNGRRDRNFRASAESNPTYVEHYGFTMDLGARYRF